MKTKIILAATIITLVAVVVVYQRIDRKVISRATAQTGGGCNNYNPLEGDCGNSECGFGFYTITAGFLDTSGPQIYG